MDNRYSVKFETTNYEQTYKIRTGGLIHSLADVQNWVDDAFKNQVLEHFSTMHELSMNRNAELSTFDKDEFEVII